MRALKCVLCCVFCFLFLVCSAVAQPAAPPKPSDNQLSDSPDPQFETRRGGSDQSSEEERQQKERQKALARERYMDLKKQSEKLLEVATELKQYVDKTNENVLSLDVMKKAEQIEKLARQIREKMKTSP